MAHWISIEEGAYLVEAAYLVTPGHTAVVLDDVTLEVYLDSNNERRVRGQAMGIAMLIVELLEDHDDLDLMLDLGDEFKYLLKTPSITGGKVFSPEVKSLFQFAAKGPVQKLSTSDYLSIRSRLSLIGLPAGGE